MENLCFTITGDFLTNISRSLWADEQEPEKALDILRTAFPDMQESDVLCVVTGFKKLVGDSNEGILLVPDDAKVSSNGNSLTLNHMFEELRNSAAREKDYLELLTGTTVFRPSPVGLIEIPRRREKEYATGKLGWKDVPCLKRASYKEEQERVRDGAIAFQEAQYTNGDKQPPTNEWVVITRWEILSMWLDGTYRLCRKVRFEGSDILGNGGLGEVL